MTAKHGGHKTKRALQTKQDGGSGEHETIKKMSFCRVVIPVKKGDIVLLEANYDLEKHPALASLWQVLDEYETQLTISIDEPSPPEKWLKTWVFCRHTLRLRNSNR